MNYKLLIKMLTVYKYISWVSLICVMNIDINMFFKLGIVASSLSIPYCINMLKEVEMNSNKIK